MDNWTVRLTTHDENERQRIEDRKERNRLDNDQIENDGD